MIINPFKLKFQPIQETRTYIIGQSNQVKSFLASRQEGTFGIEYYNDQQSKKMCFFSHSMSPINEPPTRPIILDPLRANQSCFYFHFQQQSFLPFSFKHGEDFWVLLEKNLKSQINQGAKAFLQITYQLNPNEKRKVDAYDNYNHYLNGIKNPSSIKYLLRMQYKLLDIFKPPHKPFEIDEVMEKLEQDGYRIAIRLIVEGDEKLRVKVADKIQLVLNNSRYVNAWSWTQAINKRKFVEDTQARIFPSKYKNQILCPSELQFFFGGGEVDKEELRLQPVNNLIAENKGNVLTSYKPIVVDVENEEIINDLTTAMKKLKLLKGEELKIVDFKKSLTLNMISFERPAELTIEKLRKRIEDFEIEMHVEGISFDQGAQKGSIAFMYPRKDRQSVTLEDMMNTKEFQLLKGKYELPIVVGMDTFGNPLYYDLAELVHVLIAGSTGSGKSVYLNALLLSLTMNMSPDELHLYLIDPKRVELGDYKQFPHLKKPIADSNKAGALLAEILVEMEKRYEKLEKVGVKNIKQYNKKHSSDKWSYIVVVIDEFADLMMIDDSVEDFVQRLGQMARAAGIHVIIATQRPSVDVVTGVVKANMVTRIGFTCKSHHDYKTIFDYMIPYRLIGKGDGVMSWHGNDSQFVRFQSPINMDEDIFDKIIKKWGGTVEREVVDTEYEKVETVDEKYELLKRVICESGETRNRQLQQMTNIGTHKVKDYLTQLEEEGWVEKTQRGYNLLLTGEQREKYLMILEDNA